MFSARYDWSQLIIILAITDKYDITCAKVNFIWVMCYRYSDGMFDAELYNTELFL